MISTPRDVLDFWFKETEPNLWFANDAAFDRRVRARFEETWRAARDAKLEDWKKNAEGALALVIVLDQFSRNMFRGRAASYSTDAPARAAADHAIRNKFDLEVPVGVRAFFYLPFMHSECMGDQESSVALIGERVGRDSTNYPYAVGHRAIVARFGRFPARNAALGRSSTAEETEFLRSQKAP
ncbi:MAG: DUF924 family protein [Alphaproteobacteria bacterium]